MDKPVSIHVARGPREPDRYVRLSPTVFHRVPPCYGEKPNPTIEKCWLCAVKRQCERKEPTEVK